MHELSTNALLIKRCGVSPRLGPKSCRMNFNQSERHRCWPLPGTCRKPGWIRPGSAAGEATPAPLLPCHAVPCRAMPCHAACMRQSQATLGTAAHAVAVAVVPGVPRGTRDPLRHCPVPEFPTEPHLGGSVTPAVSFPGLGAGGVLTPAVSFPGLCNAPLLSAWFCPQLGARVHPEVPGTRGGAEPGGG